ncbi:hypothetical protein A3K55_01870 [Candidatus Shapirobacteria bacterium RBG_13_44_7]|uniref:Uncharacterized protein n=1 Tax=Candidatus Shapirobacteria bacterium RBG_13_44_7 TaxID=1802149 RepID=A0A1F7SEV3_9BACT|nr:MAG: hypothetical protein A3K55_01870 [Candidatus Shapirobacteria bacterium RBG_13_44_7]
MKFGERVVLFIMTSNVDPFGACLDEVKAGGRVRRINGSWLGTFRDLAKRVNGGETIRLRVRTINSEKPWEETFLGRRH